MKKKFIIPAAAAAVLAAGYLASSWYFGQRIETVLAEIDAQITAQPWLKLVRHDYERGLLSARDTVIVEIPAFRSSGPAAEGSAESAESPLRIVLKTSVRHGPLPGFGAPAFARASTLVEFEGAAAGVPAVEVHSVYGFDGGGRSTITSPPFTIAVPAPAEGGQVTLSGEGLDFSVEFTRGLAQYSLRGGVPRLEGIGPDGARLTVSGLSIESAQQRLFSDELLYTGAQKLSIAGLEVDPGQEGKPPKIALKNVVYDVEASASGEYLDLSARLGAEGLAIGEQDYGPAAYDISMKHLEARKLAAVCRDLMALYASPEALKDKERMLRAMMPLLSSLGALLLEDPVLSIDRIAFRTPEGEAAVSASVRLPEVTAEDLARPWMLIEKIDAAAELALPVALLKALPLADGIDDEEERQKRAEAVEGAIAGFVERGYAAVDGGILKSRLVFRDGSLTANGQPVWP